MSDLCSTSAECPDGCPNCSSGVTAESVRRETCARRRDAKRQRPTQLASSSRSISFCPLSPVLMASATLSVPLHAAPRRRELRDNCAFAAERACGHAAAHAEIVWSFASSEVSSSSGLLASYCRSIRHSESVKSPAGRLRTRTPCSRRRA
eukprot:5496501-Pleurochrysis_carterae.AAC.1